MRQSDQILSETRRDLKPAAKFQWQMTYFES